MERWVLTTRAASGSERYQHEHQRRAARVEREQPFRPETLGGHARRHLGKQVTRGVAGQEQRLLGIAESELFAGDLDERRQAKADDVIAELVPADEPVHRLARRGRRRRHRRPRGAGSTIAVRPAAVSAGALSWSALLHMAQPRSQLSAKSLWGSLRPGASYWARHLPSRHLISPSLGFLRQIFRRGKQGQSVPISESCF